jgi:hypothetical protein
MFFYSSGGGFVQAVMTFFILHSFRAWRTYAHGTASRQLSPATFPRHLRVIPNAAPKKRLYGKTGHPRVTVFRICGPTLFACPKRMPGRSALYDSLETNR